MSSPAGAPVPNTHLGISRRLCGEVESLAPGEATVGLTLTEDMSVDERDLVHGGFLFGLADYAAMLAVNDPNVVLGAAEVRFLKPVTAREHVKAHARVETREGRKHRVEAQVHRGEDVVFTGSFTCFVLDRHVLG